MKKIILLSLITISVIINAFSQDIIVKNDKTEIKAKIEELTETSIKYKKIEMLDGPSYNINKRDVFMIMYKNGTKEYIESSGGQTANMQSQPQTENLQAPSYQTGSNKNSANSSNTNSNFNTSELIVPKGGVYLYKEELISSWKEMNEIFVEHNAQESIDLLKKRRTLNITGLAMTAGGVISYLTIGRNNFGVGMLSLGVALGGSLVGIVATGQPKKAVAAYNRHINNGGGKRFSFTPIINSNWQGNHVGVSIGF